MAIVQWFIDFVSILLIAGPYVVALASAVSAMTPTKSDDTFVQKYLVRFVDILALNIGNAKPEKK
jgi:hypothetical protein